MGSKRDIKFFIVPALIFLSFLFGVIGYSQLLGPDFSFSGAIYCTLFYFVLNNVAPGDVTNNLFLLISRYLAAITLGFGIYALLYRHMYEQYLRLKVRYRYRNHVILFSMKLAGIDFLSDLLANNYKVILVEDNSDSESYNKIKKDGVVVLKVEEHNAKLFDAMMVAHASACVVAFDDDDRNIALALKLTGYLRARNSRHAVRVLTHIGGSDNLEVIKDHIDIGSADENFELEVFNIYSAAAKKVYDHYPPHNYFDFRDEDSNAIAIVGYNKSAEDFIIENIILSHYKSCKNIKIYLVERDADHVLNQFMFDHPYCREFVDIVPVKLLNNKFFANFNWSKELIEKLSKVKAAYFFGDKGSELINLAVRFRQFLSGQRENYLEAPIVICYPEDTGIMGLLDMERDGPESLADQFAKHFNISFVNMISDTCTSSRLLEESEYIDLLSRVINFYYSVKYEFAGLLRDHWQIADSAALIKGIEEKMLELSGNNAQLTEREIDDMVLERIAAATGKDIKVIRPVLSIKKRWDLLSYHKKSANRYAARHLAVKLNIMKNIGCLPLTHENILNSFPVIAPVEHKRWCAEKMVLNYRYGPLPREKNTKNIAKEKLKIHDQLIPYEKLTEEEKEKDLNLFLLMPLLNSLKAEIKK